MATNVLALDAASGAPTYSGQNFRDALSVLAGPAPAGRPLGANSGVRPGTPSTTAFLSGTNNFTWNVAAHSGVMDVEASANAGPYLYSTDGTDTGTITAANATNPRIDILYMQVNDNVQDGSALESGAVMYLAGTPAASPSAPSPPNTRTLVIANITVPQVGGGNPTVAWVAPIACAPDSANVSQVGTMQTIPNAGSYTAMRLDAAGVAINQGGLYSSGATDRLTCKTIGTHRLTANASWTANATGTRRLIFEKNGGAVLSYGSIVNAVTGGAITAQTITLEVHLVPGDYVQAMLFQDSGGSLQLASTTSFSMTWINGN